MGLDMYLTKKTYIGAQYEHNNVEAKIEITINGKSVRIDPKKISYIEESAMYWRKANHIHNWFVENCQGGEDDCRTAQVNIEHLKELRDLCRQVVSDREKASETLPTKSGFFFGGTEYDEYYFSDCEETAGVLDKIIEEDEESRKNGIYPGYEYRASW